MKFHGFSYIFKKSLQILPKNLSFIILFEICNGETTTKIFFKICSEITLHVFTKMFFICCVLDKLVHVFFLNLFFEFKMYY